MLNLDTRLNKRILFMCIIIMICICGCAGHSEVREDIAETKTNISENGSKGHMNLEYATQFDVEYFEDGYALICIEDDRFVLVPEGAAIPDWKEDDMVVLQQPLTDMYVAASASLDLFDSMNQLDKVTMTSTKYSDWSLDAVRYALDEGDMEYVGKYSAPDYEYILSCDCKIAIESTMIYHSPEVKEQLELLGIPVVVERSSYESHPLGRMEWIKLYGLLCGCEEEADAYFNSKVAEVDEMLSDSQNIIGEGKQKEVAFFYITNNGYAVVRKPGDYVTKMIEMAGGDYSFDIDNSDSASSTMNMQIEAFYEGAVDADIIIYNSTIDGGISSIDELLAKSQVLADFDAVRNGNVWCTGSNVFQKSGAAADMLVELIYIINDDTENKELKFFYKIEN